jgi:hypothetical protein
MVPPRHPPTGAVRAGATRLRRGLFTLALGLAACEVGDTIERFRNEGVLCVYPDAAGRDSSPFVGPEPRTYPADRPLFLSVDFSTCLSSSCTRDPRATCSVAVTSPGVLQVTSEGSYRNTGGGLSGGPCTADCGRLIARCETPVLSAGTYHVRHGSDDLAVTLPFTGPVPCTEGK